MINNQYESVINPAINFTPLIKPVYSTSRKLTYKCRFTMEIHEYLCGCKRFSNVSIDNDIIQGSKSLHFQLIVK